MNYDSRAVGGLLVVQNFGQRLRKEILQRKSSLPYNHNQILEKYDGFDGEEMWPNLEQRNIKLENGLAPIEQFDSIIKYYNNLNDCRLLYIDPSPLSNQPLEIEFFTFVGYDFGYFNGENDHYSVIFNEIIFGFKKELRKFSKNLNENLLFSELEDINKLKEVCSDLLSSGKDVENEGEFQAIATYIYRK